MSECSGSGVKATIVTNSKKDNKRVEKSFVIDVSNDDNNSGSHLKSLRNCVNRLETQLNQYLTQIIDIENESDVSGSGGGSGQSSLGNEPIACHSDNTNRDKKSSMKSAINEYEARQRQSQEPKHKKCKK